MQDLRALASRGGPFCHARAPSSSFARPLRPNMNLWPLLPLAFFATRFCTQYLLAKLKIVANFWNPHLNAPNSMPLNRHRIFEKVPNCAEMPRIYQRSHAFSFSVVKGHGIFNILSWQVILENGHFTHWLQQNGHFTHWLISLSQ